MNLRWLRVLAGDADLAYSAPRNLPTPQEACDGRQERQRQSEEGRARLLGRPRHVDHPEMAAGNLRRRGRHLHRRPRARARSWSRRGARRRCSASSRATSSSRTCARSSSRDYVFPMFRANAALRGRLPARHLDRAAADRQEADRDRAQDRRRRGGPRRHRQGQRPGAFRAHLLCARALDQDHRAVAGVGLQEPRGADRVRRDAPDPRRQGQARRGAVLGRCQPAALLLRREGAGGPRGRAAALRLPAHHLADGGARQGNRHHDRLCQGRCREPRRQEDVAGHPARRASTSSAATTASAASTWSRTASSA